MDMAKADYTKASDDRAEAMKQAVALIQEIASLDIQKVKFGEIREALQKGIKV